MSDNLDMLWSKAKDLKHDANRYTSNNNVHGLINDLIDEIELVMAEAQNDSYEADYDVYGDNSNVVDLSMADY